MTEIENTGPEPRLAVEIARGATRLLAAHGFASVVELPLANGRRADIAAVGRGGEIWIVEVKSGVADFRADTKWPEYRAYCDRFFFAVMADFPAGLLPEDTGLILADRFGGELARPAPEHVLPAARRKAMLLRVARTAAARLSGLADPEAQHEARLVSD